MIQLQDEDVVVYETADVVSDVDDSQNVIEESTEFISRDEIPHSEALDAFVTRREFSSGDTLDAKIADIQSQIELLRLETSDSRVNSLASDIRSIAAASVFRQPAGTRPDSPAAHDAPTDAPAVILDPTCQPIQNLTSLESRLAEIEARVGYSSLPLSLVAAVNGAQERLDLLSVNETQVDTALHNLQKLVDFFKRTPVSDKITRLHDSLVSLDPVIQSLPMLVSRLKSLQTLHTETAFCQATVKDMDATLRTMKSDIDRWTHLLEELEPKLTIAVETTAQNAELAGSYLA